MFNKKLEVRIKNLERDLKWANEDIKRQNRQFRELYNTVLKIMEYYGIEENPVHETTVIVESEDD